MMNLDKKRAIFQNVFCTGDGQIVLECLAEFARADEAEFCNDPRMEAYLQGRRSVICEIRNTLKPKKEEDSE
jgi:hypothetical protein